jgi:hypothetical protein
VDIGYGGGRVVMRAGVETALGLIVTTANASLRNRRKQAENKVVK